MAAGLAKQDTNRAQSGHGKANQVVGLGKWRRLTGNENEDKDEETTRQRKTPKIQTNPSTPRRRSPRLQKLRELKDQLIQREERRRTVHSILNPERFPGVQHDKDEAEAEQIHLAGQILVHVAGQDTPDGRRRLFQHEKDLLSECFAAGRSSQTFRSYFIQAIRAALDTNNFELVEDLLGQDLSKDAFKDVDDILHAALSASLPISSGSSAKAFRLRIRDKSGALVRLLGVLIDHGASINLLNGRGNSPLYYTCLLGLQNAFKYLANMGADINTLHDPLSAGDLHQDPDALLPTSNEAKINLLQVTLVSRLRYESGFKHAWNEPIQECGGEIVVHLLNAGLKCSANDPTLVRFFQIACFQGQLAYLDKILEVGVDINGLGVRPPNTHWIGTALHAAACAGRKGVVLRLLAHGANSKAMAKTGERHCRQTKTVIGAALDHPVRGCSLEKQAVWDACEAIIHNGASPEDCRHLFYDYIWHGNVDLADRLFLRGIYISEVPYYDTKWQMLAATRGSAELMEYLLARSGPLLPVESIGEILVSNLYAKNLAMLKFLLHTYNLNINRVFTVSSDYQLQFLHPYIKRELSGSKFTLLQHAVSMVALDYSLVKFLLENGADVMCPGMPDTALGYLRKALSHGYVGEKHVDVIQLLLTYVKGPSILSGMHNRSYHGSLISETMGIYRLAAEQAEMDRSRQNRVNKTVSSLDVPSTLSKPSYNSTSARLDLSGGSGSLHASQGYSSQNPLLSHVKFSRQSLDHAQAHLRSIDLCAPRFIHRPLKKLQYIRLLKLEPADSMSVPIRGSVIKCPLIQAPKFEALSYVWGDASLVMPILLGDCLITVTMNLWSALCRLRSHDTLRILWIDALCIDQGNSKERNSQVQMMREIYQSADRVIVWLGEEDENSSLIMQHMKDHPANNNLSWSDQNKQKVDPQSDIYHAFSRLAHRSWFYRTWTIQEAVLGRKVILMCGEDLVDWDSVALHWYTEVRRSGPGSAFGPSYIPTRGVDGRDHWSILRSIRHSVAIDRVLGDRHSDLFTYSMLCEATDPRDRVYALFGMFKRPLIPVDYSLSVQEVYCRFAKARIEESESLSDIHLFGTRRLIRDLPSWVPDFSTCKPVGALPRAYDPAAFCRGLPADICFKDNVLSMSGCPICRVAKLGDELQADPPSLPGSSDFTRVLREWESIAATVPPNTLPEVRSTIRGIRPRAQYVSEAFLETLITWEHSSLANHHRHYFMLFFWYQVYGTGILKAIEEKPFSDFEDLLDVEIWAGVPYEQQKQRKAEQVAKFQERLEIACYGRRFCVTDDFRMALAPRDARVGDELVWFKGGIYPFVVRKKGKSESGIVGDCFVHDFDRQACVENMEMRPYCLH